MKPMPLKQIQLKPTQTKPTLLKQIQLKPTQTKPTQRRIRLPMKLAGCCIQPPFLPPTL